MGKTLAEDCARDAAEVFLREGDPGNEWVTYYPADGGPPRRIHVSLRRHSMPEDGQSQVSYRTDQIEIECLKDQSHALGGVARPLASAQRADALRRDGDADTEKYVFTGEILSDAPGYWRLRFTRPRPVRIGTEQRSK